MCWGGGKKSIVAASRPSQNGRRRSGLKQSKNRSPRHSPTMKWQRRSGSTRPTGAVPTVASRSRSGRPSTWVWSSARSVQVRVNLNLFILGFHQLSDADTHTRWMQAHTPINNNTVHAVHRKQPPTCTSTARPTRSEVWMEASSLSKHLL